MFRYPILLLIIISIEAAGLFLYITLLKDRFSSSIFPPWISISVGSGIRVCCQLSWKEEQGGSARISGSPQGLLYLMQWFVDGIFQVRLGHEHESLRKIRSHLQVSFYSHFYQLF